MSQIITRFIAAETQDFEGRYHGLAANSWLFRPNSTAFSTTRRVYMAMTLRIPCNARKPSGLRV